jgi:hypothetical protein
MLIPIVAIPHVIVAQFAVRGLFAVFGTLRFMRYRDSFSPPSVLAVVFRHVEILHRFGACCHVQITVLLPRSLSHMPLPFV